MAPCILDKTHFCNTARQKNKDLGVPEVFCRSSLTRILGLSAIAFGSGTFFDWSLRHSVRGWSFDGSIRRTLDDFRLAFDHGAISNNIATTG